jgi:hypothetical protein
MKKKIAVIVRDRQAEALRMAVGLTLANDEVNVFVMDVPLERSDETDMSLQALKELGVRIYSNVRDNETVFMETGEIARALVHYDNIIPY